MTFYQELLPLIVEGRFSQYDFFVTDANREAYEFITKTHFSLWPSKRAIIIGEKGSGKTHLSAIIESVQEGTLRVFSNDLLSAPFADKWRILRCNEKNSVIDGQSNEENKKNNLRRYKHINNDKNKGTVYVDHSRFNLLNNDQTSDDILREFVENFQDIIGFFMPKVIILENIDKIQDSEALLSILNLCSEWNVAILMTSSKHIEDFSHLMIQDLRSRLMTAYQLSIKKPDQNLIHALIKKQLHDMQLSLHEPLCMYLEKKMKGQTYDVIAAVLNIINQRSAQTKKKISFKMVDKIVSACDGVYSTLSI